MMFTQCFHIIVCPTRMPFQSIERQIKVFFHPYVGVISSMATWVENHFVLLHFSKDSSSITLSLPCLYSLSSSILFPIWKDLWAVKHFLGSASLCSHQDERSSSTFCSGFRQKLLSKHKLTFCYRSACMTLFFTSSVTQGTQATALKSAVSAFLTVRKSLL